MRGRGGCSGARRSKSSCRLLSGPVKYLGVEKGVNVTLGLPLVRTSPDHGTAFDIAGTGQADASSLIEAVRMARRLVVEPGAGDRVG